MTDADSGPSPSSRDVGGRAGKDDRTLVLSRHVRLLGWLRQSRESFWGVPFWLVVAVSIALTLGLGIWGFRELRVRPHLDPLESVYHALKLYTLDLGPAGGGQGAAHAGWQLWVALVFAAWLITRGALALFRGRLRRAAIRYAVRGHVVVCGAGVHGARLAQELARTRDVVLVDIDANALGMRAPHGRYEWRLVGDGVREETLIAAGARRADWVIAMAGNDFVNSQIVSAIRELANDGQIHDELRVLVQVEDPVLARFLEEEELSQESGARAVVVPFSANAIAAETLIDTVPVRRSNTEAERVEPSDAGLLEMRDGKAPNVLIAGDHPLIDALVLALLRHWRVRVLRDLEADASYRRPPVHVSVFGPGAVERVEQLRRRWHPESHVLAIEAKDAQLPGEANADIEEWLRTSDRADHAIVACREELDSVGLTLRVSRALGDGRLMTRVATQGESDLDQHLEDRTQHSRRLAKTEVISIANLACEPEHMSSLAGPERLRDALCPERRRGERTARTDGISPAQADELVRGLYDRDEDLRIRSDSGWRILPSERLMLEVLVEPVPLSAVVRAGLRIDLGHAANLRTAALTLSARARKARVHAPVDPEESDERGRAERLAHASFVAWCEFARHTTSSSPVAIRDGLTQATGAPTSDRLLLLRRATLGDDQAADRRASLDTPHGDMDGVRNMLANAAHVTILAGPAGSASATATAELLRLLKPALRGYEGAIISGGTAVGIPGVAAVAANEYGLDLVGYTPPGRGDRRLYKTIRETPEDLYDFAPTSRSAVPFSVREPLTMWTDILRAGVPADRVSVVVFRGGQITTEELLIARALGARVAWLDPYGAATAPLADTLPLGDEGILELPADAMTIRAFITRSRLPEELRELVAQYLHSDYRRKQRGRESPGDPALAPWDELLDTLKDSNRAQANDIPNKLALIGQRPIPHGARLELADEEIELLAEAEHGRWNVERLSAGWELGERNIGHGLTPHLRPWNELTNERKAFDREGVMNISPALAEAGWGVAPI